MTSCVISVGENGQTKSQTPSGTMTPHFLGLKKTARNARHHTQQTDEYIQRKRDKAARWPTTNNRPPPLHPTVTLYLRLIPQPSASTQNARPKTHAPSRLFERNKNNTQQKKESRRLVATIDTRSQIQPNWCKHSALSTSSNTAPRC